MLNWEEIVFENEYSAGLYKVLRMREAVEQANAEALAVLTSQEAHGRFAHAGHCVVVN